MLKENEEVKGNAVIQLLRLGRVKMEERAELYNQMVHIHVVVDM